MGVKKIQSELTLSQVADKLGCHKSTVGRQVRALGLGRMVGQRVVLITGNEYKRLKAVITPGVPGRKVGK